jgi:hypothetical protein
VLHVRSPPIREIAAQTFVQGRNKCGCCSELPGGRAGAWLPVIWLYDTLAVARRLAVLRDGALRARLAAWGYACEERAHQRAARGSGGHARSATGQPVGHARRLRITARRMRGRGGD